MAPRVISKKFRREDEEPTFDTPSPAKSSGDDTVTVACKLPKGLILRVFDMEDMEEATTGGSRRFKKARQVGPAIPIKGFALPFGAMPNFQMEGGFALTPGVPREFFEKWLRDNHDQDFVKKGLVFAHVQHDKVVGRAKENAKLKSGMEPVDPDNPPPGFRKGPNGGVEKFNPKDMGA